jgi:deoxyadenosine/deoxycytidine kinase
MREPIEKWTKPDKDGVSILEKFYKDKEKYTFSFQVYVATNHHRCGEGHRENEPCV